MLKILAGLLLVACFFSCNHESATPGCEPQACTEVFVTFGIHYTDKAGNPITVQNFSAINQRTHLAMPNMQTGLLMTGYYVVANDSVKQQLSTDGDDILISATNPATNQTKIVTVRLAGGCNCHVTKISGPETVAFD
ncbi:hypothetical protein [Mucilaginibacter boryungensis]|uniref:Uncharacterized protein n=1 Tax=Mucilaginibacter boryungensis TaxID=768480 RepID=A0ABR9XIN6_9SPHI|nr:hypothetical protein [Mucilaginibacter boryungensis]MBE9666910.1 hypothetical protein [Mucilaginibacter boryungensis]